MSLRRTIAEAQYQYDGPQNPSGGSQNTTSQSGLAATKFCTTMTPPSRRIISTNEYTITYSDEKTFLAADHQLLARPLAHAHAGDIQETSTSTPNSRASANLGTKKLTQQSSIADHFRRLVHRWCSAPSKISHYCPCIP